MPNNPLPPALIAAIENKAKQEYGTGFAGDNYIRVAKEGATLTLQEQEEPMGWLVNGYHFFHTKPTLPDDKIETCEALSFYSPTLPPVADEEVVDIIFKLIAENGTMDTVAPNVSTWKVDALKAAQAIASMFSQKVVSAEDIKCAMAAFSLWRTNNNWYWYEVMNGVAGWSTDKMRIDEILSDEQLYHFYLTSLKEQ